MRPKSQRGKRWTAFAQSPRHEESALFRDHIRWLRQFLHDEALPPGLPPEAYLSKRLERLARYEEHFQALVCGCQAELNRRDRALLQNAEPIAELGISASLLLDSEAVWRRMIAETWKNPPSLRNLDSRQFEEMIAFIFREFGYEVELTKRTRDGGRDIVAVRRAEIAGRYLIECKQPYSGAKIGIAPVRELYAVKVDERATKAILATTSFFTKEARLFFERHRWELEPRDYDGVMEWIRSYLGGHSQ